MLWKRLGCFRVIVVPANLCQLKSSLHVTENDVEQSDAVGSLDLGDQLDGDGNGGSIRLSDGRPDHKVISYLPRQKENRAIETLGLSRQLS